MQIGPQVFFPKKQIAGLLLLLGSQAQAAKAPFLVVLDPGHGGTDWGATYRTDHEIITEKQLTLEVAQALSQELQRNGIATLLTRDRDIQLPLPERTALANRAGAQVFLSLHLNTTRDPHENQASGFETYLLNHSSNATSQRLASLENSVLEGSFTEAFEKPEVGLIVKDLVLSGNLAKNHQLACLLQKELSHTQPPALRKKKDRGVKQAFFYVLLGADMPSLLVEIGFLNNPEDRRWIQSKDGQKQIAGAITQAIERFQQKPAPEKSLCSVMK